MSKNSSGARNDPVAREKTAGKGRRGGAPAEIHGPHPGWSDEDLIRECVGGNEQAWSALIDKYKNLIFSIPLKYGASPEDAADIFQSVCLELFAELPRLRKTAAFSAWLITVTAHQSFHWKRKHIRRAERERTDVEAEELEALPTAVPADMIEEVQREQMVRDATARLPPRCQEMIRLLFFSEPAVPYREVARRLGLATGSIGFIRGRCLRRLQKTLQKMGF
jgi:RNA polymerase sigma factor (sigma-70 family)